MKAKAFVLGTFIANNLVSGPDCMKIWPLGSIPKNIKIVVWDWSQSLNIEPWDWSHRLDFNRRDRSRLYIGTWFYDLVLSYAASVECVLSSVAWWRCVLLCVVSVECVLSSVKRGGRCDLSSTWNMESRRTKKRKVAAPPPPFVSVRSCTWAAVVW